MKSKRPIYIASISQISIQQPLSEQWMHTPSLPQGMYNEAADPDFKQWLSAGEARRLGKIMKRAVATSSSCMKASGVSCPDAVITATGLGCVKNTELFLTDLCVGGEQLLKPTQFMQSTHNTIGSLIAIHNKCHGYNNTYAHRNISAEIAMLDAVTQLSLGKIDTALVGAFDEITPNYYKMLERIGYYGVPGMVTSGETAVSMMLQCGDNAAPLCRVDEIIVKYNLTDDRIVELLEKMGVADCIMAGYNGIEHIDRWYDTILNRLGYNNCILQYKNLFGEGMTASAFGIYCAAHILASACVPSEMVVRGSLPEKPADILCLNISDKEFAAVKLTLE